MWLFLSPLLIIIALFLLLLDGKQKKQDQDSAISQEQRIKELKELSQKNSQEARAKNRAIKNKLDRS